MIKNSKKIQMLTMASVAVLALSACQTTGTQNNRMAKIDAAIETRGPAHVDDIIAALRATNFQVRQLEDSAS